MKYLAMLLFLLPLSSYADSYCKRETKMDVEFPAGLKGIYDIVGREPKTNTLYSGIVELDYSEESYKLIRIVKDSRINGDAWIEYCGADKSMHLFAQYDTAPLILEYFCSLGGDGDNYYRITCRTRWNNSESKEYGLEALFQRH